MTILHSGAMPIRATVSLPLKIGAMPVRASSLPVLSLHSWAVSISFMAPALHVSPVALILHVHGLMSSITGSGHGNPAQPGRTDHRRRHYCQNLLHFFSSHFQDVCLWTDAGAEAYCMPYS
ncbi:MAG: hypothetical protein J6N67_03090 [Desulfovibrio sp.]|nr:hypothetical protein [Desulfovibrio sp.]